MKKLLSLSYIALSIPLSMVTAQAGFTKINSTVLSQISPDNIIYRGAAWVDINNDGKIDLFVAPSFLFKNLGNGNFERMTTTIGASNVQEAVGTTWADIDNDGNIDCFIAGEPSATYLNNGQGSFNRLTTGELDTYNKPAWGAAWADYNNDGRLDLISVYPKNFLSPPNLPCYLFKNTGGLTYRSINGYAFTDAVDFYTVPYWSDYDLDGDLDLFIASGPGGSFAAKDYHYKNLLKETGRDTFERITNTKFSKDLHDGQCYNFIDYDNDGDLDLCLTNYAAAFTKLYKNTNGVYDTVATPFSRKRTSLSNVWGDFDNDGDLDVLIANDNALPVMYHSNEGNDLFTATSFGNTMVGGNCITACDYDNDGDLDIFVQGIPPVRGLYQNNNLASGRSWALFTCVGTASNKSAIGTKVRIKATIYGKTFWQYRDISAQNTFQGQSDLRAHFGLGDAAKIDSVMVDWSLGRHEVFTNLNANQLYRIIEGQGISNINPTSESESTPLSISPNPVRKLLKINGLDNAEIINSIEIIDVSGKVVLNKNSIINKSESIEIDVSSLSNGLYIVRAKTMKGQLFTAKCTIEH